MSWWLNELVGAVALGLLAVNAWVLIGVLARNAGVSRAAVVLGLITFGWLAGH